MSGEFPRDRAAQQELAMPALQPVTRLARWYTHTPLRLEFVESQRIQHPSFSFSISTAKLMTREESAKSDENYSTLIKKTLSF